ncbi:MAG: Na(+)/H(+) antiporter subunit B [Halanaerobiaceae bacterium]
MSNLILPVLFIFLIITASTAIFTTNLINSVISLSVFSGILVLIFVFLQAPDVAMAEAVISAGITTSFFIITINKTED